MFAWTPIPEAFAQLGSMEFAKRLLAEAGVAVSPGVGFGEEGEGYVRIALVENEQRIRQAARGVKAMLAKGACPAVPAKAESTPGSLRQLSLETARASAFGKPVQAAS